jgi:hypothetical protein
MMSLNVFVTLCIVGIDFLVYFLFQWTYGDKRRAMARKLAAIRRASGPQSSGPLAVSAQSSGHRVVQMPARDRESSSNPTASYNRRLA